MQRMQRFSLKGGCPQDAWTRLMLNALFDLSNSNCMGLLVNSLDLQVSVVHKCALVGESSCEKSCWQLMFSDNPSEGYLQWVRCYA